uniref:Uncharacterized protein n=1 Tax=Setaria italica TaxID=4555 RepID=K3XUG1_SETIT
MESRRMHARVGYDRQARVLVYWCLHTPIEEHPLCLHD